MACGTFLSVTLLAPQEVAPTLTPLSEAQLRGTSSPLVRYTTVYKIMKNWKDSLLKSGLPLEYEAKQQFIKYNCVVKDEFTYIKSNENNILKEFSYDLDAALYNYVDTFNFLIECKYRSPGIKWVFLPHSKSLKNDQNYNSILHTVDFFKERNSEFETPEFLSSFPHRLGPFCKKGIEIGDAKNDESSIRKGIYQLSYGMIEKILQSMEIQINFETFFSKSIIFHHIPIIITTAELYLINNKITINEIENSKDLIDIATKEDFLIYQHDIGLDLRKHNSERLTNFFKPEMKKKAVQKLRRPKKNVEDLINYIAGEFSLKSIIIINHKEESYSKLFKYIGELMNPSEDTKSKYNENKKEYYKYISKMMESFKKPTTK
ncbi:hypothetical protein LEP1GSC196_2956 [Leptospira meyeri serovar Semaranga str. Veldrot Semarang 173]|nr:hypothetical protein LEP1GSC196_2956 [Leptospira meyeri serovar Semaranga str. Veldrot Semarang 173]